MFRVHAKFMMQGLYVLYMLSTDLRGSLNGARSVERRVKETCSWLLSFFFFFLGVWRGYFNIKSHEITRR